jgi:putative membrane-bound dehydrogenase-like protein
MVFHSFRLICVTIVVFFGALNCIAQIPRAKDAPQPMSPENSLKCMQLPADLTATLVAAEPLIADPTGIAWDERGRLFVCELHGYNLEGHLEVQELNKTGKLDKAIRRKFASKEMVAEARRRTYGTIKLLKDTNGDGRMDSATVFAGKLPPCYGIIPARGGIIAVCATDIIFLEDKDGDGKAEVRKTMFEGFRMHVIERAINNPRWGADNWIYVSAGADGGSVRGPGLDKTIALGRSEFRFKADGSAFEPVVGGNGTFGLALNDWDDRFLVVFQYATPLPYRYLVRNPFTPSPGSKANGSSDERVYAASEPHPWRRLRAKDPRWVRFYGAHETGQDHFTGPSGQMIYRASLFPQAYRGNHFICEPSRNLVHRSLLERAGAGYKMRRPDSEQKTEFLRSTDQWFRPINLHTGPDGAIHVVDMYREIIEDYSAIPRYLQQQYGLIEGDDRGRIWRIAPKDLKNQAWNLAAYSSRKLVKSLNHTNAWHRLTAQRLLIERADRSVADMLSDTANESKLPQTRMHALYTLDGLGLLKPSHLTKALGDSHFAVRFHALRLADRLLNSNEQLLAKVVSMSGDADLRVRLQLAMSLGEAKSPAVIDTLAVLTRKHGHERWMNSAILSSVNNRADQLLTRLYSNSEKHATEGTLAVTRLLTASIGSTRNDQQIGHALKTIAAIKGKQADEAITRSLSGILDGINRSKFTGVESKEGRVAIASLLSHSSSQVRESALRLLAALKMRDSPMMEKVYRRASIDAVNSKLSLPSRLASIHMLKTATFDQIKPVFKKISAPRQPIELQLAAVDMLAACEDKAIAATVLETWSRYSPRVQARAMDLLLGRSDRLKALLGAIENGTVKSNVLTAFQQARLIEHSDKAISIRARELLVRKSSSAESEKLYARFQPALKRAGDAARGQSLFAKHCQACHRVRNKGFAVGPDLSTTRTRPDETILADILEPSSKITSGYQSYVIETDDGEIIAGALASESATSITLKTAKAKTYTLLRNRIDSMRLSSLSLMPSNMGELLQPQDAADIIAYLRKSFGQLLNSGIVLFDDEPEFIDVLVDGGGKATLRKDERYFGNASLSITPLQRHSSRIKNWAYKIAKTPGPDEYRYLRLAWKTSKGKGIMIELAAEGRWPSSSTPKRRYYSGQNTTKWQAKQVSSHAPRQWTVVTIDLYKDCGAFTLTGIAPTALEGEAFFDRIELLRTLE